jgi:hypothetical protein
MFFDGIYHPRTGERAEMMVILDDDVQFKPEDLWRIVALAREKNAPAGGMYVTRSRTPQIASMQLPGQHFFFGAELPPEPVRYLATGFMAIPLSTVEEVQRKGAEEGFADIEGQRHLHYCEQGVGDKPLWDFFSCFNIREDGSQPWYDTDNRVHMLSEDWAFCERVRQCGIDIWADPAVFLSHRAYVSITPLDLAEPGHMLGPDGAAAGGASILFVDPKEEDAAQDKEQAVGSIEEELVAVSS